MAIASSGTFESGPYNVPSSGAFWRGADGNVYVAGSGGTHSAGRWDANTSNYWTSRNFNQIADPNRRATVNQAQVNGVSSGGAPPNQNKIDYINRSFDAQKEQYNSQLRTLGPQQDAAEGRIINQYTTRNNDLRSDFAKGNRNLDTSQNKVNSERERGLDSIRRQLQQQSMSYANQLGAFGAGDSSASTLINQALTGSAARNRGDLLGNVTDQTVAINTQRKDLEDSFDRNTRDLVTWKQSTLTDIAEKFLAQKQKIRTAMASADAERANQLAQLDENLTQDALNKLSHLEDVYRQNANELVAQYRNALAPSTVKIAPELQDYAVKPIDAGQLADIGQVQSNVAEDPLAVLRRKEEDELANGPLPV